MTTPKRIALAGFQHETNTFAPGLASFEEFEKHDGWPGLTRGQDLLSTVQGMNLPIAGFAESVNASDYQLVPILWCSAEPSGYVTRDAFERISTMICEGLASCGTVDGLYLDLHGAMVTEQFEDAEGELLRRVRAVLGPEVPVVASLDLHANVSPAMVELTTALCIYRTYPHLDMATCGGRAARLMEQALRNGGMHKTWRQARYLVPLSAQCTDLEPCRTLYSEIQRLSAGNELSADLAMGFPPADVHDAGPFLVVYGDHPERVERAADQLLDLLVRVEKDFDNRLWPADKAVLEALANTKEGPVILADAQDNPGAGAISDTVGVLEALVRHKARGAVVAIVHDPEVAAMAHRAGPGAVLNAELGGKSDVRGVSPYSGSFRVETLADGRFTCTGEMYRGTRTELGPMALLKILEPDCDVRVIVGSVRFQCLDQAIFRHLGIEPIDQRILVVKSTVHFRADFNPLAAHTLVVESPGANPCRMIGLDYRRLRTGVRLEPMGPPHAG